MTTTPIHSSHDRLVVCLDGEITPHGAQEFVLAVDQRLERYFCEHLEVVVASPGGSGPLRAEAATVAPEHRCAPYDKRRDYPYPQSVERDIVRELGAVYGPYTGTCFSSTRETDIEHVVAASEAHDSGLCAADAATKARFARDLRNLTLAAPAVNRYQKSGKDAAEWVPDRNRCWFAARVVEVRRAYGLSVDRREAAALERILAACESTALEPIVCAAPSGSAVGAASAPAGGDDALALYDDNGNGRITCAEARRHGIAPVPRSRPAYRPLRLAFLVFHRPPREPAVVS